MSLFAEVESGGRAKAIAINFYCSCSRADNDPFVGYINIPLLHMIRTVAANQVNSFQCKNKISNKKKTYYCSQEWFNDGFSELDVDFMWFHEPQPWMHFISFCNQRWSSSRFFMLKVCLQPRKNREGETF